MSERYVVDTSVLIQAYVSEVDTKRVQTLLHGLEKPDPDELNIPEFCLVECVNVLWKHVRLHGMPLSTAKQAIEALLALTLTIHAASDLLPRTLEIGLSHDLAIYDAVHITLAENLGCSLITVDEKQAKAASVVGVSLKPITDFPEFVEPEE